jgi:serine/threonine-protein kinase
MAVNDALIQAAAALLAVSVTRPLKQGGQKTVLLAESEGRPLVLKVIGLGSSLPDALRRAQREVELLQGIDHPNVVRVASDLVEVGDPRVGAAWLEAYLEGDDLSELVGPDPWEWPEVKTMALDVARGLSALHCVNVVHRDLSASNVRRLTGGSWVVMDPGFARHEDRSDLTVGGQPGTPGFLSPEHVQAYSGAPTAASDVFCVGNLMVLALTGQTAIPFTGDQGDYVSRLARVETVDVASLRPDLPPPVLEVIARCLHAQPARRYRNGSRLSEALEQLA